MTGLLASEQGITTPFDIHLDMAPSVYLIGNPGRTDPSVRAFERASGKLTAKNPITGNTDNLTLFMADPVELKLLHMVTADKFRTPTFVLFGDPNYFFLTFGGTSLDSGFAWNHGGVAPEINTTFLGMVGPGVKADGVDADPADGTYTFLEGEIAALTGVRNSLSKEIIGLLEGAEFHGKTISSSDAQRLSGETQQLLHQMQALTH